MDIVPKELWQYQTAEGRIPFIEWFNSLKDKVDQNRIRYRLFRTKSGNYGDCKIVGQGVFELRFHHGPGHRIYFGQHGDKIVLLLTGGDKSSQQKDIAKAIMYWMDFKRRHVYETISFL